MAIKTKKATRKALKASKVDDLMIKSEDDIEDNGNDGEKQQKQRKITKRKTKPKTPMRQPKVKILKKRANTEII